MNLKTMKIEELVEQYDQALNTPMDDSDFDVFNDLDVLYLNMADRIAEKNEKIADLFDEMQDIIAEISYGDDTINQRKKMGEILNKIKTLI